MIYHCIKIGAQALHRSSDLDDQVSEIDISCFLLHFIISHNTYLFLDSPELLEPQEPD